LAAGRKVLGPMLFMILKIFLPKKWQTNWHTLLIIQKLMYAENVIISLALKKIFNFLHCYL
jgi:hypothetical protein